MEPNKKQIVNILIFAVIITIIGLLITSFLLFIKIDYWNIISGFSLGVGISFINYGLLVLIIYMVTNEYLHNKFFLIIIFILRSFIYMGVFIIAGWKNDWFNIFSVFSGTLILIIATYINQSWTFIQERCWKKQC